MDPKDKEKTSFITEHGTLLQSHAYEIKNAEATYKFLVNKMFEEDIRKIIKVYAEDMMVKSHKDEDHVFYLS